MPQRIKLKNKKFHGQFVHVHWLNTQWICKCDQFKLCNGRTHCDHTSFAILVSNGNPTNIPILTVPLSDRYSSEKYCDYDAVNIFLSDEARRSTVFSVHDGALKYSFVYQTSTERHVKCTTHHKDSSCTCKQIVYEKLPHLRPEKTKSKYTFKVDNGGWASYIKGIDLSTLLSKLTIPVPQSHRTKSDCTPHQDHYDALPPSRNVPEDFFPLREKCECGHQFNPILDLEPLTSAVYYDSYCAFDVNIHNLKCPDCQKQYYFDGLFHRVLAVHSNKRLRLIPHSLIREFESLHVTRCNWITSKQAIYQSQNSKHQFPSSATFQKWAEKFWAQTDWTKKLGCSKCKALGKLPKYVSWDGTAQLLNAGRVEHIITPKDTHQFNDVVIQMDKFIAKLRRQGKIVYIKQRPIRKHLENWIIKENIHRRKNDTDIKDREASFPNLIRSLRSNGYDVLCDFLSKFNVQRRELSKKIITGIGKLLRNFSTYNIFAVIVPFCLTECLSNYSPDTWTQHSNIIRLNQPHLWKLLDDYTKSRIPQSPEFIALIQDVARKSKIYCDALIEHRLKSPPAPVAPTVFNSLVTDSEISGCHYPKYKVEHLRPSYDFPSETSKNKSKLSETEDDEYPNGDCRKLYHVHRDMSNGICTFLCAEHHELMGYHILKNPESVNDCFSLMMMLYPGNTAPKAILCDNACAAHKYFIHREPLKFLNTLFICDQFHQQGHKCGCYYCVSGWKTSDPSTPFLNDSEIESINSKLEKGRKSNGFMMLSRFDKDIVDTLECYDRDSIRAREADE